MIQISLCDDDNSIIDSLKHDISVFRSDIEIFSCNSGEDLLESEFLCNDIIFLDIEMKGINGIHAAKELRSKGYEGILIFLTSHKEMVFDSFQVKPFRYLVKPMDMSVVKDVLDKAISELIDKRNTHFEAVCNNHTYRILLCDIYYFESQRRNLDIFTKNGIITITGKINKVEASLRNKQFFRCHKGYLVNLEHIYEFSDSEIILTNQQKVLISRLKLNSFKEAFRAFMKGNKGC